VKVSFLFAIGVLLLSGCSTTKKNSSNEHLDLIGNKEAVLVYWVVKKKIAPKYPQQANTKRISGCVEFSLIIDSSGNAINPAGSITYKLPKFSGLQLGGSYNPRSGASSNADGGTSEGSGKAGWEYAADWSPEMVPGLRVGGVIGQCEDCNAASKDTDEQTFFATYAYGPLSIGYQVAEIDNGTKTYDTDVYGVSFNVNDALSVSYQYGETTGYGGSYNKAEFEGISAAYNIGPMAIKFTDNSGTDMNGTSNDDDNRELNLSMSF